MSSSKSNKVLSHEQQEQMLSLLASGEHSKRGIASMMRISDSTVRKYAEKLGVNAFSAAVDPKDPILMMGRQIARQADTLRMLRSQVKSVNERGFGYDDFMTALTRFVETEKLKPLVYYPTQIQKAKKLGPVPAVKPGHTEIATLTLSDWHLTEVVRKADSNGINVYNTLIAANRLWAVVQKFKQIYQLQSAAFKFDKIWLPVLGDLISGSIHEEFISSNDATDQCAQILGIRLLEMVILELKSHGIPIELDCYVGNHPRTTKKVPTKNIAHTNLEWLCYEVVKMLFRDDKQVTVNVHTSQFGIVEQYGHKYMLEHGIDWKNGKESDTESRLRDLLDDPIYRKANGNQGASFDNIIIGNLHTPKFLERTVVNGSLIGQNELGQQWRLKPIRAQQMMFGISRSHVRTFQYGLDVTNVRSDKVENPFSEFASEFLKDHGRYIHVA